VLVACFVSCVNTSPGDRPIFVCVNTITAGPIQACVLTVFALPGVSCAQNIRMILGSEYFFCARANTMTILYFFKSCYFKARIVYGRYFLGTLYVRTVCSLWVHYFILFHPSLSKWLKVISQITGEQVIV
jgi:hypothetical protein